MAFEIFGYKITKNKKEQQELANRFIPTPVTPSNNDGSTVVSVGNSALMSGYYQYNFDICCQEFLHIFLLVFSS